MARISKALHLLNIDVRLIPDIDVINNEEIFKNIVAEYGVDWESIKKDYDILVSNLHSPRERISRNDAKTTINRILSGSNDIYLSNSEMASIRDSIKTISKWEALKKGGVNSIPSGDATNSFKNIEKILCNGVVY